MDTATALGEDQSSQPGLRERPAPRATGPGARLLVAVVALDIAIQAINILNQTRLFALSASERSRMNTAFVTNNFVGGAIGSAAASVLWSAGGWGAVMAAAVVASLFALVVWALGRRGPLVVEAPR